VEPDGGATSYPSCARPPPAAADVRGFDLLSDALVRNDTARDQGTTTPIGGPDRVSLPHKHAFGHDHARSADADLLAVHLDLDTAWASDSMALLDEHC